MAEEVYIVAATKDIIKATDSSSSDRREFFTCKKTAEWVADNKTRTNPPAKFKVHQCVIMFIGEYKELTEPSDNKIKQYLLDHMGEADNSTVLVEMCASHFNREDWLDDSTHDVWVWALELWRDLD